MSAEVEEPRQTPLPRSRLGDAFNRLRSDTIKLRYKLSGATSLTVLVTYETARGLEISKGIDLALALGAGVVAWGTVMFRYVQPSPYLQDTDPEMLGSHMAYWEARGDSRWLNPNTVASERATHRYYSRALLFAERLGDLKDLERISEKARLTGPETGPIPIRQRLRLR